MRLPRDVSGEDLARRLARLGHTVTRQTGSYLLLTRRAGLGEQHLTIPRHASLRVGTLAGVLRDVAEQVGKSRDEVLEELFGSTR